MKINQVYKSISMSLVLSALFLGCSGGGGGGGSSSYASSPKVQGSVVKGPIDGASLKIYDANHTEVASTTTSNGSFSLDMKTLTSPYYTVESSGGRYEDEATKKILVLNSSEGLKTLLSKEKLQMIIDNKEFISMTPETTIYTELVLEHISSDGLSKASTDAKKLIYDFMIMNSSPLVSLEADKFTQVGDLSAKLPENQNEAFAKNRAVSFSYMVNDLGLEPEKSFELIQKIVDDYKDVWQMVLV